jgi:adenylosuccinate synthase
MVNGFDELAVTNLDGLDSVSTLKVCVAYEIKGKRVKYPPVDFRDWQGAKPIYRTFKGWKQDTSKIREYKKLPLAAREYLKAICDLTGAPLKIVSVGAQRDATLFV